MNKLSTALFFALGLAFIPAAHATDGVIEINQARALAGGITAGDTAGYPVTISQAGSYRLTSNLIQSDPNVNVIDITHDNVTVDLNGFTISGSNVCTLSADAWPGKTISCNGMGAGYGVYAAAHANVSVVNGNINGMGAGCIRISSFDPGEAQRVENVRVSHCGGIGIRIGKGSVARSGASFCSGGGIYLVNGEISAVFAEGNGGPGISGSNVSISGSTAHKNLNIGIDSSGIVSKSVATQNQDAGIRASAGAFNNYATGNHGNGITLDSGTASGNTSIGNDGDGITVNSMGSVIANVMSNNGGYGLNVLAYRVVYSQNIFRANGLGSFNGTVIQTPAASNLCDALICP